VRVSLAKLLDRRLGGIALRLARPARLARDLFTGDGQIRAVREIAVVKFWGIGNAALLLPLLHGLKRRYPAARLTVVTLEQNAPVLRGAADRVLTVRFSRAPVDLLAVAASLRRRRIDLAIDAEQYVRSSQLLLFLAGARQVIAFDTPGQRRADLADIAVPFDDGVHTSEMYLRLFQAAGLKERRYVPGGLEADPGIKVAVPPRRPLAILHPGSGDNFPGRRWPTRRFGLVARRLVDAGAVVAVTGGAGETAMAREVVEASGRDLLDLSGKLSLDELVAWLARANVLVSNDTGPVHLASALGVSVLGLYGPNTPLLYGPLSPGSVAFYDAPACSPCITNFNYKTSRCRNPVCIHAIGVDEVADAAVRRVTDAAVRERRA